MVDTKHIHDLAIDIAHDAGKIMRQYFAEIDKGTEIKGDKSPVTIADKLINAMLITRVAEAFPEHAVLGEEISTNLQGKKEVWVCDPIDGTSAFIFGLPTAMFSLAFVYDGEPLVGVAYDPFLERMFTAIKGEKAFCNGQEIRVGNQALKDAFVAGPSYVTTLYNTDMLYKDLAEKGAHIPMFPGGVYKGCLVAEGKLHGRIYSGPWAYDIAAIKVLIEAAGGKVTDLNGNEQRYDQRINGAILSNGIIHEDLVAAVRRIGGAAKVTGKA